MNLFEIVKYILENDFSTLFYTPPIYNSAKSYLFRNVSKSVICNIPNEIGNKLDEIDQLIQNGYEGFGAISYEAGYIFEDKLKNYLTDYSGNDLISFHFCKPKDVSVFNSTDLSYSEIEEYAEKNTANISQLDLNTSKEKYISDIKKIKSYIAEGDTYQVNYTIAGSFETNGEIISLIYNLFFNQSAQYCSIMNLGTEIIISISPELFFETKANRIVTRPMKGTAKRGVNIGNDKNNAEDLKRDPKNRAENTMIVDLLRNDLGKICDYDSVKAESICDIEKYETLYQMTSKVSGSLKTNSLKEILKNIYPCGSITGAPKIRTMEIIKELETESRGYYTGAIGFIKNDLKVFNVPIRTVVIDKGLQKGKIGIGSGIVWDSNPEEEYEEVLLKADFLQKMREEFRLFETILVENGEIFLSDYHLKRLKESADYFLFKFDEIMYSNYFEELLAKLDDKKKYRVKILLNKWGVFNSEISDYHDEKKRYSLTLSGNKINTDNLFQYFKTTNRELYNLERDNIQNRFDEVIFLNERDELTEGTITNLFFKIDEEWYTPPISSGILNGCYRQMLLEKKHDHHKKILTLDDLHKCSAIKCVNSLRGEIMVENVFYVGKIIKEFENLKK